MVSDEKGGGFIEAISVDTTSVEDPSRYPYNLPSVEKLGQLDMARGVTILVGENGTGKSTILEALAVALGFNPEGGSVNMRFATRESHSDLHKHLKVRRGVRRESTGYFLRSETLYNVATSIEELDRAGSESGLGKPIISSYGGNSLHNQSHGESFLTLFLERFGGNGLYLLDEPEAALSPSRQLAILSRMHDLVRQGSQFIIATHSPVLMAYPGALIYVLSESGYRRTAYDETEHYSLTRAFLNQPEQYLRHLMDD